MTYYEVTINGKKAKMRINTDGTAEPIELETIAGHIELEQWVANLKKNPAFRTGKQARYGAEKSWKVLHESASFQDANNDDFATAHRTIVVQKDDNNAEEFERYYDIISQSNYLTVERYVNEDGEEGMVVRRKTQ